MDHCARVPDDHKNQDIRDHDTHIDVDEQTKKSLPEHANAAIPYGIEQRESQQQEGQYVDVELDVHA